MKNNHSFFFLFVMTTSNGTIGKSIVHELKSSVKLQGTMGCIIYVLHKTTTHL
jgi:hypothetical protein